MNQMVKPDVSAGRLERTGHVPKKSERADQVQLAQVRSTLAEAPQLGMGRKLETDTERQDNESQ